MIIFIIIDNISPFETRFVERDVISNPVHCNLVPPQKIYKNFKWLFGSYTGQDLMNDELYIAQPNHQHSYYSIAAVVEKWFTEIGLDRHRQQKFFVVG